MSLFPATIEQIIQQAFDFVMFYIFDAVWRGLSTLELFKAKNVIPIA